MNADLAWDVMLRIPTRGPAVQGTAAANRWLREAVTIETVQGWIARGIEAAGRESSGVYVTGISYAPEEIVPFGWDGSAQKVRVTVHANVDGGNPVPFAIILLALAIIAGTVVADVLVESVTGKGVFRRLGEGLGAAAKPIATTLGWVALGIVVLVLSMGGALSAGRLRLARGKGA